MGFFLEGWEIAYPSKERGDLVEFLQRIPWAGNSNTNLCDGRVPLLLFHL